MSFDFPNMMSNNSNPLSNDPDLYMGQLQMSQISPQSQAPPTQPPQQKIPLNNNNYVGNYSNYNQNSQPPQQPQQTQQGFADVNYSSYLMNQQPPLPPSSLNPAKQLFHTYYHQNELLSPSVQAAIPQPQTRINSPNFPANANIYDILSTPQNNNNNNYPPLKRVKYENEPAQGGYANNMQTNSYYSMQNSAPNSSPNMNQITPSSVNPSLSSPLSSSLSSSSSFPISPPSFMPNCNIPTNQIALNKECALHLAKRVANDLNVLIKFVSALEGDYIPNQNQLFTAKQSISKFTDSLQASQSPTFRDDPPQTDLSDTMLEHYTLLDTLGTGTFGRVRLCKYNITSEYFCVKILSKEKVVRLKQQEHVKSEKSILLQCKHPFIVKLYTTFQDEKNLYLIMEYISGGELFTVIKKTGGLQTNIARIYAAEIILVIEYLHKRNIIHRDLKPENVLIDKLGHLKLTDFGFAKQINNDKTWTMCGTPEYIAPEIILSKGHGKCVDWWSLGVLLYEMLAGHPPFQGDNNYSVFQNILSGEVKIPPHFDPNAADLITKLLSLDITQRLGCMKGGASEVKSHSFFAGVDWDALYHKRCWGPIHPKVGFANDTSNFLNDEGDSELSNAFTGDQNIFKEF